MLIAICDDDLATREQCKKAVTDFLAKEGLKADVVLFESGTQLLFSLAGREAPPDIILLDIMMPKIDGVEVARQLRSNGYMGAIVFLTRSSDRTFDAFDVGAFNYVVKDADSVNRLHQVLASAIATMERRKGDFILINGISEHRNLPISSIRYFEINKHVCTVHYGPGVGEAFEFVSSLDRLENMTLLCGFVRIHRSYLVNCHYVKKYTFRKCVLDNGIELPVGRARYADLRSAMESQAAIIAGSGTTDTQS